MLRLNLASGTDIREGDGWQNWDIASWPTARRGPDVYWDARTDVIGVESSLVDEIFAGYLLLHVNPTHHEPLLREMYRVLRPGCLLTVDEVNTPEVMRRWLASPTDRSCNELIWGEMGSVHGDAMADYDSHRCGFTENTLRDMLVRHGFVGVTRIRRHAPAVWWDLTFTARKP